MSSSEGSEGSTTSTHGLTHSLLRQCAPSIVIAEDLICSYCEENLKTGRVGKKLRCDHIFHPACILRFLARNRSCPTCGCDLTAIDPQDRSDDPNIAEVSHNVVNPEVADDEESRPEEAGEEKSSDDDDDGDDETRRGPLSILLRRLANTEISEVMLCVICQKNLKPGDVAKKLACEHIFHSHCIANHYKRSHEHCCPLCRREI